MERKKDKKNILIIFLLVIVFAIMHNGIINIIYTFILGVILNVIYIKSKNLLYPIIIHCSANFITLFLTGYNVYILGLSFILLLTSMLVVKRDYLLK